MEKVGFHLPTAEDDLWQQVVVRLLEQRDGDEEQARNHLRLLEELAFHHRFCGKPLARAFAEDTATWLAKDRDFGSPRDTAQTWLVDVERWELLVRRGSGQDTTYEFAIPTLDEYFAARHLAARWAEDDKGYRTWLPLRRNWWLMGRKLHCPNPCCQSLLPPFRESMRQSDYQETLLLMVGLMKETERETVLLSGLQSDVELALKAVSRCRHSHPDIIDDVISSLESKMWPLAKGLAALGTARVKANVDFTVNSFMVKARTVDNLFKDKQACTAVASILQYIGEAAIEPLVNSLRDKHWKVRGIAAESLGRIGHAQAVEPLIAALRDEERAVAESAALSLGWIGHTLAVEPLIELLQHKTNFCLCEAAATALGLIGDARAVKALIQLVEWDENSHALLLHALARYRAASALGEIGHVEAIEALMQVSSDARDDVVEFRAREALRQISKKNRVCIFRDGRWETLHEHLEFSTPWGTAVRRE